jgi:hypothetical protein
MYRRKCMKYEEGWLFDFEDGVTKLLRNIFTIYQLTITVPYSCSNLSLTNTSVAAVRTSGFWFSVFRFPVFRLFHDTPTIQLKHPQRNAHLPLRRESGSHGGKVVSSFLGTSGEISFSTVLFCAKMVTTITEVITQYEERVRRISVTPWTARGTCSTSMHLRNQVWTRCIVIIFRFRFYASFHSHVPLIARSSVTIFRLRF